MSEVVVPASYVESVSMRSAAIGSKLCVEPGSASLASTAVTSISAVVAGDAASTLAPAVLAPASTSARPAGASRRSSTGASWGAMVAVAAGSGANVRSSPVIGDSLS